MRLRNENNSEASFTYDPVGRLGSVRKEMSQTPHETSQ
ncbi:hypothetical protein [Pseudomonas sp. TDA1]